MKKNSDIITTFATAAGDLAVHTETSGGRFKTLTYMISESLAESSRQRYRIHHLPDMMLQRLHAGQLAVLADVVHPAKRHLPLLP